MSLRVVSRDRRSGQHGEVNVRLDRSLGSTWRARWKGVFVDLKPAFSPTKMGKLKPDQVVDLFFYLFFITPAMMLCSFIQQAGVTFAELRQAYVDQNFMRIIKYRLSVKLINDLVIFIMMMIYVHKMFALDRQKQDMSGKELQEVFSLHPRSYLAIIYFEPLFKLTHNSECYLIAVTAFSFLNQTPGKLVMATKRALYSALFTDGVVRLLCRVLVKAAVVVLVAAFSHVVHGISGLVGFQTSGHNLSFVFYLVLAMFLVPFLVRFVQHFDIEQFNQHKIL